MRVLVTGIAGFIGHHLAEYILKHTDWDVVGLDRIDSTSTLHRLKDIDGWADHQSRVDFVWHDLRAPINDLVADRIGRVDFIVHLAASTHVDRSITHPLEFVQDNVLGTANLLQYARSLMPRLKALINFSTDEVFGPALGNTMYSEWDRYRSTNPYAASKAGAAELGLAFQNTYGLPVITTYANNVFGKRQHWEKFIPHVIRSVVLDTEVKIHANQNLTKPGSRFYIDAENIAAACLFLLNKGVVGEKYNLVGELEVNNLTLARAIAAEVAAFVAESPSAPASVACRYTRERAGHRGDAEPVTLKYELVDFHSSRPGHDLRYGIDGAKLKYMGFTYPQTFEESLAAVVRWSLEHPEWLGLSK